MNTSFPKAFEDCAPGFRARALRPRPGMTMLQFELRHYPGAGTHQTCPQAVERESSTGSADCRCRNSLQAGHLLTL